MGDEFDTSHDMIARARRTLGHDTWDYICGGAESETSLRRNRVALDCIAFRPRVLRCLERLETEIETTMGLIGVTSLDQLDASYVTRAMPVTLPHEMSAFPHLPGGRLV